MIVCSHYSAGARILQWVSWINTSGKLPTVGELVMDSRPSVAFLNFGDAEPTAAINVFDKGIPHR